MSNAAAQSNEERARKLRATHVGWLLAERFALVVSSVIVGFWVVRTLGPDQFGRFSAALSVTAVFAALSTMGLETAVLRRLVQPSISKASLLAAAGMLRLGGSLLGVVISWAAAALLFPETPDVSFIALIVASSAIFRIADLVGLWLQAEGRYGTATALRLGTRLGGDLFRVVLILAHASIYWFAAAFVIEAVVGLALFGAASRPLISPKKSHEISPLIRPLYRDGRPILISAILAACYARIDQMILFSVYGPVETGHYAAAVRISETFNLVVTSIGSVAATHFGRLQSADEETFNSRLMPYHRWMLLAGLSLSALLCASAGPVIRFAYGDAFLEAIPLLRIHAWSIALVFASAALEPWFYHHRKLDYYVPKTLIALAFAVPLTLVATHMFGPAGTAASVVATYGLSVFGTNVLIPGVRGAFRFQMRSMGIFEGHNR